MGSSCTTINKKNSEKKKSKSEKIIKSPILASNPIERGPSSSIQPVDMSVQKDFPDPIQPDTTIKPILPMSSYPQIPKLPVVNKNLSQSSIPQQNKNHYLNLLTPSQITILEEKFKQSQKSDLGLDLPAFKNAMPYISHLPAPVIENAFQVFSNPLNGHISYLDFCMSVSKYILGTTEEKCRFLYTIFENKKEKTLTRQEAGQLNRYLESISQGSDLEMSSSSILSLFQSSSQLNFEVFKSWAFDNLDLHKALQPFEVIPSAATEKEFFKVEMMKFQKVGLEVGEYYYLISVSWLQIWKDFVKFDLDMQDCSPRVSYRLRSRPDDIKNSNLIDPEMNEKLKPGLKEGQDFEILPKRVWKDLQKWYNGGPEIRRKAIQVQNRRFLEVYLVHFQVSIKKGAKETRVNIFVSQNDQVLDILAKLSKNVEEMKSLRFLLKISSKFKYFESGTLIRSLPLSEVNICQVKSINQDDLQYIPSELQDLSPGENIEYHYKGYWMLAAVDRVSENEIFIKTNWKKTQIAVPFSSLRKLRKPRMTAIKDKLINSAIGLVNLGNTCFLNSTLQALFHTPLFKDYFSSSTFLVNLVDSKVKPLIQKLFELGIEYKTTQKPKIRPDTFYKELLKHTFEFQEGRENDCHELLLVLLSIVHEGLAESELNMQMTVRLKNFNENDERIASKKQWKEYREEKGSIISAIFAGQTRNCFTCNNCGTKKVIFEVFNDFSVPIPRTNAVFAGYVMFVPMKNENIEKIAIFLKPDDTFEKFLQIIEQKSQVKSTKLVFAYNRKGICLNLFQPLDLSDLFKRKTHELCAFEVFAYLSEIESISKFFFNDHKNPAWRDELKKLQLVDVFHEGKWRIGHIYEIDNDRVKIKSHTIPSSRLTLAKKSEDLQPFTSQVQVIKRIINIPVNHIKVGSNTYFGIPQVLSIGSWFTWHEVLMALNSLVLTYCSTFKSTENTKFYLYNSKKAGCGICNDSCQGCEINDCFGIVSGLVDFVQDLFIRVFWIDSSCYKYCEPRVHSRLEEFNIHECFDKFSEKEVIDLKCENCDEKNQTSQIEVWRLPDILVIHFKRFCNERNYLNKIDSLIKFPIKGLNMSLLMLNSKKRAGFCVKNSENNFLYDLFAVINHNGNISTGHYTSYCLNEDDKWLLFDDDKVFLLNKEIEDEIVSNKAYILFYKRQRFRPSNILHTRDILNRV